MGTATEFVLGILIVIAYIIYDQMKDRKTAAQRAAKKASKKGKNRHKSGISTVPYVPGPIPIPQEGPPPPPPAAAKHKGVALSALKSLGFKKADAKYHVAAAVESAPDASAEDLVRLALASSQGRLE